MKPKRPQLPRPQPRETQTVEWKSTWHDDFLKTICGLANAQGGKLLIGMNDKGDPIGVKDARKLLEELPNKIRATMGIVAEVNLRTQRARNPPATPAPRAPLDIIEITIPPYPNPISYRGKHYQRSGSTTQELTGHALDAMLLRKYGRTYDSMPLPRIKTTDFWHDAFDIFRKKALASKRLAREDVDIPDAALLRTLKLVENNRLLLAAALLFHQTPEQWCLGATVKIGRFTHDAQILYQDELTGPLVAMSDKVVETIFTKYFIGRIRYEGLQRIDDYPMPREALREAVTNALVHRDYSTGNSIQIRVYDDHVTIANDCRLPEGATLETLSTARTSVTHNPLIALAMFRTGQIEAWGRGLERLIAACQADKLPPPDFVITPRTFTIRFHIRNMAAAKNDTTSEPLNDGINVGGNVGINDGIKYTLDAIDRRLLDLMRADARITVSEMAVRIGKGRRFVERRIAGLRTTCLSRLGPRKSGHWKVADTTGSTKNEPLNGMINEPLNETINPLETELLAAMRENPGIGKEALALKTGKSRATLTRAIQSLVKSGKLKRIGSRKTGHWKTNFP